MNPNDITSLAIHPPSRTPEVTPPEPPEAELSEVRAERMERPEKTEQPKGISKEDLQSAIDHLNTFMDSQDRALKFSVDKQSHRIVVKIVDLKTQEVLRQFPAELTLKLAENLSKGQENVTGLMLNIDV